MSIKPLSRTTIHLLGSAQVLTTPASLVKELVDNALDARATSIDILISSNTLDKIEVRDNGHGIPNEDLDSLGRRGHTSKLRSFEELRNLGGLTLGFRGEALASAVELGEVSITSRIEGEPTATLIKLKAPGGIASQSRASHPNGTTISVANFMASLPVRKKNALKDATKTLAKIKELLNSYALARPSTRFNLRINKGTKGGWSFAPRPSDGIKEAVSQVIGREAALQCIEKSTTFSSMLVKKGGNPIDDEGELEVVTEANMPSTLTQSSDYCVQALLPKPDADPAKVGKGQYLSIDHRPVSHEKGAMKKIITIYKKYLRNSIKATSSETLKSPFLYLSITCPVASYDANVEPAKDDVLFDNETLILESIEAFFKNIYGSSDEPKAVSTTPAPRSLAGKLDSFEILLNRGSTKSVASGSSIPLKPNDTVQCPDATISGSDLLPSTKLPAADENIAADTSGSPVAARAKKRRWNFDMSTDYTQQVEEPERKSGHKSFARPSLSRLADGDVDDTPNAGLNPWVVAKLNAPVQERIRTNPIQTTRSNHEEPTVSGSAQLPVLPHRAAHMKGFSSSTMNHLASVDDLSGRRSISPPIQITNPLLHVNQGRRPLSPQRDLTDPLSDRDPMLLDEDVRDHFRPVNDFVSARQLPQEPLLTPPSTDRGISSKRPRGPNKPFVNPFKNSQVGLMPDSLRQMKLRAEYQLPREQNDASTEQQKQPNAELAWAMEFEQRKEDATRRRREELRSSRKYSGDALLVETPPRSSPYKNRYNAAIAVLDTPLQSEEPARQKECIKTSLPDGDPRAYLIRRQKSMAASNGLTKLKRMKTGLLPLENIPESQQMYNLMYSVSHNIDDIRKSTVLLANYDSYAARGNETSGIEISTEEATPIITRIKKAMEDWKIQADPTNQCEILYNFGNMVKGKSPALA